MDEKAETIHGFYGVYLLYCKNEKYLGRTYIGYTVDPHRRIKQHNRGRHAGGAWKTSNKGPWVMVMIIHGFPNSIAALRFEWAWQHPNLSRSLKHLPRKKPREKTFDYNLRILSEMLNVGPWSRLPLNIRWLDRDFLRDFPLDKQPPNHMAICHGPVISKKIAKSTVQYEETVSPCVVCFQLLEHKPLTCLTSDCHLVVHPVCLSDLFLKPGEYVPIEGDCPVCNTRLLWGDLVRKYKGCYGEENLVVNTEIGDIEI